MAGNTINVQGSYIDVHDNEVVNLSVDKATVKMQNEAKIKPVKPKTQKPRETMTLGRKSVVTDAHLQLLFMKLAQDGLIEGNESDFKALFSGKRDEDCVVVWTGKFGKSTLVGIFKQLLNEMLLVVPEGYNLPSILEGHFTDTEGRWLTGLDKGDAPNAKALPLIAEYVKLLKLKPDRMFE